MMNNLQNKLSSFKATPPLGVWDKIAEALDAENDFGQRLYHYQEAPKANVWNKLEASLGESVPAIVIPFTTRYRRPIYYTAAASIIAVVLVSATLLMKRTEAGSIPTAEQKTLPAEEAIVQNLVTTPTINSNTQTEMIAAETKNESNVYSTGTRQKRTLSFINPESVLGSFVMGRSFVPEDVYKKEMFNASSLNDYMVCSDEDGNTMKLPKKLFSLVNCPDGDDSCKERIHQMQKLSARAIATDFTGLVEMVNQLQ